MALWVGALLAATSIVGPPREPIHVINGNVAGECQWPSTVLMPGCSGTLVHPEIILYAAHCPNAGTAGFGVIGNDRFVAVAECNDGELYPATGHDHAWCRLAEPVTDVPIVPILMGCERDQLTVDRPVVLVGFGNTNNDGDGFGTKRWVDGTIAGFPNDGRMVGVFYEDNDTGICSGDSGGSGFVQLDDGSWRLWGITTSVAGQCGGSSQHNPAWVAVAEIEEETGIDITPCHDADGAWNPSEDCTAFPLDPNDGSGLSWSDGCGPGMQSPAAATCGPAVGEPQDTTAPTITIVSPAPGAYEGPELSTSIEIEASDDWGILDVTITFADVDPAILEAEPYTLGSVIFPEGSWEIVAVTRDWSGNEAMTSVTIEVGDVPMQTGSGGGSESSSGTSEASTSATTFDPTDGSSDDAGTDTEIDPPASGDTGCGCRSTTPAPWLLLFLVPFTRRRRTWLRTHS